MIVTIDNAQIARMKAAIENTGRQLRKELVIAVNYTAKESKKIIVKQIGSELAVAQKNIAKVVEVTRKANGNDISATVEVNKDKRLNLKDFGARQTKGGVSYKVSKSNKGRTKAKNGFIIQKFAWKVYSRVAKARGPLRQLRGPSAWGVFVKGQKIGPSVEQIEARLKHEIDRRIRFILGKASGAF